MHQPGESSIRINRHAPKPLLARFVLVNTCTAINLLLGVLSILSTMTGFLTLGAFLLMGSVLFDALDGNLARRWRVQTDFGAQMDSLADMVAFTVASALLAWYWLAPQLPSPVMTIAASGYILMGAIRLARFNSGAYNPDFFQGVPTTAVAGIVASTYLLSPGFEAGAGAALFMLLGVLMVSTLPYLKFTQLRRVPRVLWLLAGAGLIVNAQLTAFMIEAAYLLSGPALWLNLKRRRH